MFSDHDHLSGVKDFGPEHVDTHVYTGTPSDKKSQFHFVLLQPLLRQEMKETRFSLGEGQKNATKLVPEALVGVCL